VQVHRGLLADVVLEHGVHASDECGRDRGKSKPRPHSEVEHGVSTWHIAVIKRSRDGSREVGLT
jgi:hypothetical protein